MYTQEKEVAMDDCIFCKIVKGDIPCFKIYEDEWTLAFLDIANDMEGHTLVIPKQHARNMLDCPASLFAAVMATVQKVSQHYVQDCGFDGVNVLNANEPCAEQSVFHLHMHILPRKKVAEVIKTFPELPGSGKSLDDVWQALKWDECQQLTEKSTSCEQFQTLVSDAVSNNTKKRLNVATGMDLKGGFSCKASGNDVEVKSITVYTDGACSGNPGVGGYAAILNYNGQEKIVSGGEKNTTNNRMELMAVIQGLEKIKEGCHVDVYSDSAYVVNAFLQDWISGWQQNGWHTKGKGEVLNSDLWKRLLLQVNRHDVSWHKVKGHSTNELNNRCDEIARNEIDKIKKSITEVID